jgi:hypothetical protein
LPPRYRRRDGDPRSLMREMMGRDPFDDPFFRDPFGMMGGGMMGGGMPGMVRFTGQRSTVHGCMLSPSVG